MLAIVASAQLSPLIFKLFREQTKVPCHFRIENGAQILRHKKRSLNLETGHDGVALAPRPAVEAGGGVPPVGGVRRDGGVGSLGRPRDGARRRAEVAAARVHLAQLVAALVAVRRLAAAVLERPVELLLELS